MRGRVLISFLAIVWLALMKSRVGRTGGRPRVARADQQPLGTPREGHGVRVLMLLENNPLPPDPRVAHEAAALIAAGYTLTVVCPRGPGQPRRETLNGVTIYRYPAWTPGNGTFGFAVEYGYALAAIAALTLFLRIRDGFDIIHVHNPPDAVAFIAAAFRPFGARVIFDHHDLAPEMYAASFGPSHRRWLYNLQARIEILACRVADHVIATNDSYKRRQMERSGIPAERITVVRNGPDPEDFRAVPPDPVLRARAKTIIGYAGIMGRQDGVDYLLRAIHHLVYDLGRRDAFCAIIGTGDARPELMALASELGLDDYVWFSGWVSDEDFLRYQSTIDIGVVPDPSNPFTDRSTMLKLLNYMALGKPAVAFDLPEHRVSAGDAACYVPPNDEYAFAQALAALMDDPERRAAMGQRGRQRIETQMAWCYSVPALLAAYRQVRDGGGATSPSLLHRVRGGVQRIAAKG